VQGLRPFLFYRNVFPPLFILNISSDGPLFFTSSEMVERETEFFSAPLEACSPAVMFKSTDF
jgi:hypothetical protein